MIKYRSCLDTMTAIPTIANVKMMRGLTFWDPSGFQRWKDGLCEKAGEALINFSKEKHASEDSFDVKSFIPRADIVRFKGETPILRKGSRSFYFGLSCILEEFEETKVLLAGSQVCCGNSWRRLCEERDLRVQQLQEVDEMTQLGGCGTPSDWHYCLEEDDPSNCLAVRKWYEWVGGTIPGRKGRDDENISVCDSRMEILNPCGWAVIAPGEQERESMYLPPANWWELVEQLEESYLDMEESRDDFEKVADDLAEQNDKIRETNQRLIEQNTRLLKHFRDFKNALDEKGFGSLWEQMLHEKMFDPV